MNNKLKKGKSIEEQVEILISRGMIINDKEKAKEYLLKIGYYRLSGYGYQFRKKVDGKIIDEFKEGTTFENVIDLYSFDRKLKLLMLDGIERIELYIQTRIAYLLGERNPVAHLDPKELHGNFIRKTKTGESQYEKGLEKYKKQKERFRTKDFVKHNINKYGELPIGVAVEIFDFTSLSIFYSGMKYQDKEKIQNDIFEYNKLYLESWLRSLNYIRNISAHHSRLGNINFLEMVKIPKEEQKLKLLKKEKVFIYICIIQMIIKEIHPDSKGGNEIKELLQNFPKIKNNSVSIENMGIIKDGEKGDIGQ